MGKIICCSIVVIIILSLILTDLLGVGQKKYHRKNQLMYREVYKSKKYISFEEKTGYIYCDGE